MAVDGGVKRVGIGENVGESDGASSEGKAPKDDGDVGTALDPLWLSSEGERSASRFVGTRERGSTVGGNEKLLRDES